MSLFRLVSSPPTSPESRQPFTFALPSPPTPREDGPSAPSTRFEEAGMRVFGARPMDDQGREGGVFRCPVGCGRVVAAGGLAGHVGESRAQRECAAGKETSSEASIRASQTREFRRERRRSRKDRRRRRQQALPSKASIQEPQARQSLRARRRARHSSCIADNQFGSVICEAT